MAEEHLDNIGWSLSLMICSGEHQNKPKCWPLETLNWANTDVTLTLAVWINMWCDTTHHMAQSERISSESDNNNNLIQWNSLYDQLKLRTFQYTDHNVVDLEIDVDPENNFFYNISNNCCYFNDEQFKHTINTENKWSIIHLIAEVYVAVSII